MRTSCWRSGRGRVACHGLAGGLGAGVGEVDGGAGVADAAGSGGEVVDGVGQLGMGAQAAG